MSQTRVKEASSTSKVYKEECMYCFNTPEHQGGLYICLSSFWGACPKHLQLLESKKSSGHLAHLVRKRRRKPEGKAVETTKESSSEPENKITKLAIGVAGGFKTEEKSIYDISDTWTYVKNCDVAKAGSEISSNDPQLDPVIAKSIASVIAAESANKLRELEALAGTWDGSLRQVSACALDLHQIENPPQIKPYGMKCQTAGCDKKDNLWVNLSDGRVLCGRKCFDGTGGNGHAKDYYEKTTYPLCVKLGTITPSGADVYSYPEDDMVEDPHLSKHLAHFGINMMEMEKTEKTMLELELDLNQKHEWSAIQEDGLSLKPVFGPGFTGMINLGSSCYINSSIQALCMVPDFVERFSKSAAATFQALPSADDPSSDFNAQISKVFSSLESGAYSDPDAADAATKDYDPTRDLPPSNGIRPMVFRHIVGRGHPEFSSARQQDAEEYLRYLFELIERHNGNQQTDPTSAVKFMLEDRTQCNASKAVLYERRNDVILSIPVAMETVTNKEDVDTYKAEQEKAKANNERLAPERVVLPKVSLDACICKWAGDQTMEDFYSEATKTRGTATRRVRLASFPDYLLMQVQKFTMKDDWTPLKLEVELQLPPDDILDLSTLRGSGIQPGETPMPEGTGGAQAGPAMDENVLAQLLGMGFNENSCKKAIIRTKNAGVEAATNWLMEHMDDPDFTEPPAELAAQKRASSKSAVNPELVANLTALGFSEAQAKTALKACNNDVSTAGEWLFTHPDAPIDTGDDDHVAMETDGAGASGALPPGIRDGTGRYELVGFISHMGSSTHCGHYVCHVRKAGKWVIFNDEKVAESQAPPKGLGYIYLWKRL